ncbi:DNA-formamidopyrimidine glycosylase family protein, partial [Acinetobacter baumannii]
TAMASWMPVNGGRRHAERAENRFMPELPEVATTRRGLAPHLQGRRVHGVILRRADLRWPIPP